jgi:import receptor subunit TOM20
VTGIIAYAVYFDHRRRNDPEFRKALKRESKKIAKAAKEEALAQSSQQKKLVKQAVDLANEEGFPQDAEEVEAYFMQEVARGESLCQEGMMMLSVNGSEQLLI